MPYLANHILQVGRTSSFVALLVAVALIHKVLIDLVVGKNGGLRFNDLHGAW